MMVNGVNTTQTSQTSTITKKDLGKEDFLKLLILQMQNQDPLEPMKNEEFVAQLAQFNSLEQMQNLNKTMASQTNLQSVSQTASLIGKSVVIQDSNGNQAAGVVKQVAYKDGEARLLVLDQNGSSHIATVDMVRLIQ
jgi:flagellar basal-body rod modification protein FlgD